MSDRPAQDNYTRPSPTNWAQKPIRCPRVGMNTVPVLLLFAAASMSARFKSENKIADLPVEPELPSVVSTPRVHWRAILGIGRGIANARARLRFFVAQRKITKNHAEIDRRRPKMRPTFSVEREGGPLPGQRAETLPPRTMRHCPKSSRSRLKLARNRFPRPESPPLLPTAFSASGLRKILCTRAFVRE